MMTEVTMTMSNLHPGFILIAVGLIALFVPKSPVSYTHLTLPTTPYV